MIDLHNHTYFSYDGSELPDDLADNAVSNGIDTIGICDHQFTEGFNFEEYVAAMRDAAMRWKGRCNIKVGLEIGTRPKPNNLLAKQAAPKLDYCLFECLDSATGMDFFEFIEWRRLFGCPVGLAHTDIFELSRRYDMDIAAVMKKEEIFWEINTSGNYTYYYDFLTNPKKREYVRKSGITISVGSDTHQLFRYDARKVISANDLAISLGNRIIFGRGW